LSASFGGLALADPAYAASVLPLAEAAGVDLLVLGTPASLPFDPQVLAAWAAPRLSRMGVVPVVSARITHPFHAARSLSAIDYLSDGLLGWCPVGEGESPAQVADLVRATRALWDGWDADCLIMDKASGRYLDSSKVRASHYQGTHYKVRGPVNAMRPKQGHPLLMCDGLHIDLTDPHAQLPWVGERFASLTQGRPASGTLRQRLGLPLTLAASKIEENA
jgi:alkanesulfonate monooxygenase SsuD/methylene tetrahydromethanopterin reductase-like flavin-dependent oxidoreductase (luciferase family)